MSNSNPPPNALEQLPILQKATDAYKLWHSFLPHFPRLSRYTLGAKINTIFTAILELILTAKYADKSQKLNWINQSIVKLDSLKFFLKIAWEIKALDNKKYIRLSEPLSEIGKMIGGWRKQLLNSVT